MKIAALLVSIILIFSITLFSQTKNFEGVWTSDTSFYIKNPEVDSLFPNYLRTMQDYSIQIKSNGSEWFILTNQLYIEFANKFTKDTLFLLFKNVDFGRGFLLFEGSIPKVNSLFAKCFITTKNRLSITYLNKNFIKAIKTCIIFSSEQEEEKLFPKTLYFISKKLDYEPD